MTGLTISDAPLLIGVTGGEKIPTGGRGDGVVTVDMIKEYVDSDFDEKAKPLLDEKANKDDLDDLKIIVDGKPNLTDVYTKTEVDGKLDAKANASSVYTKEEVDDEIVLKANKVDVDSDLSSKADKETTYTKEEVDDMITSSTSGVVSVNGSSGIVVIDRDSLGVPTDVEISEMEKEDRFVKTWSGRTQEGKNRDVVHGRDFGIVGDYETDDDDAFDDACLYSVENNVAIDLSGLNIGLSRSHILPKGVRLCADAPHTIITWLSNADKEKVSPNKKHLVSGGNIWIKGVTNSYETNRLDDYSSISYGLLYPHLEPLRMSGVGVILDCDIYSGSGTLTNRANDNLVNCDAGLILRSYDPQLTNINIFGYFKKASLVLHSQQDLENVDSDYCWAVNSFFTSVALVGDETGNNGLTGSNWSDCHFYSCGDYHIESEGDYTRNAIFVDGKVSGATGIRGHKFGGHLRCRSNDAVHLDNARNIVLDFHVVETPIFPYLGADAQGTVTVTANTNGVFQSYFSGAEQSFNINEVIKNSSNNKPILAIGGRYKDGFIASRGKSTALLRVTDNTQDPVLQLTEDATDPNSGIQILRDISENGALVIKDGNNFRLKIASDGTTTLYGDVIANTKVRSKGNLRLDTNVIELTNGVDLIMNGGTYYLQASASGFRSSTGFKCGATSSATWTSGNPVPTGTAVVGSLYSCTSNSVDGGLWAYEQSGWVKK